jgi:hypothetical protein
MSATMAEDWRVAGSYFEACNCEAICPCRSVRGVPGGASTYGECFGVLSWRIDEGHIDALDLSGRLVVLTLRYFDRVEETPWEVVAYVDEGASDEQLEALGRIFTGRAGGTVASNYGNAIDTVHAVRRARIVLDHDESRRKISVVGTIYVEAEDPASGPGEVACGIPGLERPGTELFGEGMYSTDPLLRFEVKGRRHAAFATDFDYHSSPSS